VRTAVDTATRVGLSEFCRRGEHRQCAELGLRCDCDCPFHHEELWDLVNELLGRRPKIRAPKPAVPALPLARTEEEVAADTIVALRRAGHTGTATLNELALAAGVPATQVHRAEHRWEVGEWRLPGTELSLPAPRKKITGRVAWNKRPEGPTRECIQCHRVLPIESFQQRTDVNSRRTKCDDCRKHYSRERYIKVADRAIVTQLLAGDVHIGHHCPRCGQKFLAGQRVRGSELHHEDCKYRRKKKRRSKP